MRHQEGQQRDDPQAQHHGHTPQQQMRLLNPARPRNGLFGNLLKFADDFPKSRSGEAFLDTVMQRLDGLDDLLRFEPAKLGGCGLHSSPAG